MMTLLDGPPKRVLNVGYVSDADFYRSCRWPIAAFSGKHAPPTKQTFTRFDSQYGLPALSEFGSIT